MYESFMQLNYSLFFRSSCIPTIAAKILLILNLSWINGAEGSRTLHDKHFFNNVRQILEKEAKERTICKITVLLMSNLIENEPESVQRRISNCIRRCYTWQTYWNCVKFLIKKHRRNLLRRTKREIIRRKSTFSLGKPTNVKLEHGFLYDIGQLLHAIVQKMKIRIFGNNDFSVSTSADHMKNTVAMFLQSPLIGLKSKLDFDVTRSDIPSVVNNDGRMRILSPRIFSAFDDSNQGINLLSPDILSLSRDSSSALSFTRLLQNMSVKDQRPWSKLVDEINEIGHLLQSNIFNEPMLRHSNISIDGIELPTESFYDFFEDMKIEDVYKVLSVDQLEKLNQRGYVTMTRNQIFRIYKKTDNDWLNKDECEKETMLIDIVENYFWKSFRKKRATTPTPCSTPSLLGGTIISPTVLYPQTLCPGVFAFVILGPFVLSPYIVSPYILSPYVLAPNILSPVTLSPNVLSPNVIGPYVLSPFILNPYVLSPNLLSPNVLSPNVLSPSILSPGLLSPDVLSPDVLSPDIMSPSILSPCLLCRRRRKK
uniref:Uncharacterized protein n=1 Tax=Romanomermis culicivorax TaxID=13658 RepID=A0A915I0L1_ROMCU